MNQDEILDKLGASIEAYDIDEAEKYARLAMDEGISPDDAINLGLAKGMDTISRLFDEAKIFLPQILMAAKAMEAALDIIEPYMKKGDDVKLKGVIVMGSVKGDIHEIGKNVCCAMLRGAGFKVIDLGTDVSPYAFEKAIEESNADVVGGSALMTTSLYQQKDMVRVFNEDKLPVITIFGGAPCSEEWVNEIGGDGYSASGSEIVELVRRLLSEKPDGSE
ncbi:dimethylamine methyltransferase [Methanomassiliicoccaceae archaeon DOK]|nr:dimethylamine methyltransferase [Methanomassiliicoccaceae archaeon DOK]